MKTTNEVKEELREYLHNVAYIQAKEQEIEKYRDKATSCTSQITDMPQARGVQDKVAEYAAIIADMQMENYDKLIAVEAKKRKVENNIDKLDQPYKNILYLKYILGYSLTQVANEIKYDYKWTCKLHGEALQNYREVEEC